MPQYFPLAVWRMLAWCPLIVWPLAICSISVCLMCDRPAWGQLPAARLDGVFPAGGKAGDTIDVTIFGGDLDDVDRLSFSHQGISAKPKLAAATPFDDGPQPIENQFVVSIANNVPPGGYELRCQGKYGISGPRKFVVDSRQQVVEIEPNASAETATEIADLPIVVNGQLNGTADLDFYQFQGSAGQRLMIAGDAYSIDSPASLVLALIDADGRVLAESQRAGNRDPVLDITLPYTGIYLLRANDLLYAGGANFVYRIVIGNQPSIDFVFPPAGLPDSNDEYTVYGRNLPDGQPSNLSRGGHKLEQIKTRIAIPADIIGNLRVSAPMEPYQASLDAIEYRVTSPTGSSNAALITVAQAPVVFEQADNDTPQTAQELTPPCEVAGQFYPQRDVDWYSLQAKADQAFWIEVFSHRLGVPTDSSLVVFAVESSESGEETFKQIAWVNSATVRNGGFEFDERSNDPVYRFQAPADGTYRILVRDGRSSVVSDPSLVYRLSVRPAKPDFRLAITPIDSSGSVFLRKGGREAVKVVVFRQDGFDGEVKLSASGLPPGVSASEMIVGPDSHHAVLTLSAAKDTASATSDVKIIGTSTIAGQQVARTARIGQPLANVPFAQPNNPGQASLAARLVDRLPVVVSESEMERITLSAVEPISFETSRGGIVKVKYQVTRDSGAGGTIAGFAFGLPAVMNVPQFNIGGDTGEIEFRFPANMTPGTYSPNIAATVQGMNYVRNPEATELAKARQTRVAAILVDAQKAAQESQVAATQAATDLTQANTRVSQATAAKNSATAAVTTATTAQKSTEQALASAKAKLAMSPDDAAAKTAVAVAEKNDADAISQLIVVSEAEKVAITVSEKAMQEQTAAMQAKSNADEALKNAQQFQTLAQQQKQQADQKANQLQQQSTSRAFNHLIFATPVTIKVDDYPIRLTGPPEKLMVKQGESAEIPLGIERLYGFNQPVNVQTILPSGIAGLQIPNTSIAAAAAQAAVAVTAQPTATPGDHPLTLRLTLNFNGQNLTLDRTCLLTVEGN